jgi:hypothetical protein
MKHIKKNLLQAVLWLMLGLVPQLAWAEVPNVINYQGYLTDSSGSPLKGTVNITLTFWDALTAGNRVGSPKSYTNVKVNNGVLSQNVDVSYITFDGQIYLEMTINGETLAPRQLVTSVPAAYRAKTAADVEKLDGVDISDNGNVGIGTATPNSKLEVAGTIHSTSGGVKFPDGTTQTTAATGGGSGDGHSLDAADGTPTDAVYVDNNGNVGIGTTSPGAKLDVNGDIVSNGYRKKIGSSQIDPKRYINILYQYKKSSANSLCPSGVAIATSFNYLGKTGSEICAGDVRGRTTCKAVKSVYGTWAGIFGTYLPYDKTCEQELIASWPWAITPNHPNTLDTEWDIRTFVVCCE